MGAQSTMNARTAAWTVEIVSCILITDYKMKRFDGDVRTDVDCKIKNINPNNGNNDDAVLDKGRFSVGTKENKETANNRSNPRQREQRSNCCQSTSNHKRLSSTPFDSAVVALDANIRLHERTGQGACYPDKGQKRLANAKRK